MSMKVILITSHKRSENKLIIVDFWAPCVGLCKQLTPIMEKVAKENTQIVLI